MAWLTLWLKKIILLVLLAAFLDLILPNTNLQKYVKMVMGLIILLTILSPLFSIFSISTDELAFRIQRFQTENLTPTKNRDWKPLANKMLGQQNEQMTQYFVSNMEKHIETKLKDEYQIDTAKASVKVEEDHSGTLVIKEIYINMGQKSTPGTTTSQIRDIQPVVIEVDSKQLEDPKVTPVTAGQQNSQHEEIARAFSKEFDVNIDRIHITSEEESSRVNVTNQRR